MEEHSTKNTIPHGLKARVLLGGTKNEIFCEHGETCILMSQQLKDCISYRAWLKCQIAHIVHDLHTLANLLHHITFLALQTFAF